MSGADLEYQRMLTQAGISIELAAGFDAARLEQIIDILTAEGTVGGGGGGTGTDGRSITNIAKTSTVGNVDTYTISMSAPPNYTFSVTNGVVGSNGAPGAPGAPGADGTDGATLVSLVRTAGDGSPGSDDTWTFTFSDDSEYDFTVHNGADVSATSIREFADWDDAIPTAEGYMPVFDPETVKYVDTDPSDRFALVDSGLRLDPSNYPKYFVPMVVLPEGDAVPSDFSPGGLVWDRPVPPSITPVYRGSGFQAGAGTVFTFVTTAALAVGDWVGISVLCSAETTSGVLPTTMTVVPTTGAWTVTAGIEQHQSGTVQLNLKYAQVTTAIPVGTTITVTLNQSRIHKSCVLFLMPNLIDVSPGDQAAVGGDGSSTNLNINVGPTPTTTQDNELAVMVIGNNDSSGAITRPVVGINGWLNLFSIESDNGSSSRQQTIMYKTLDVAANITGECNVNASDGQTGAWTGIVHTFKAEAL